MVFGVDVGGTTVKIGLVDGIKIVDKYEIPTRKETLFDDICLSIKKYMKEHCIDKITGIGFGLPGNVIKNYIYNLPNVGLKNINLTEKVNAYFPNVPIFSQNDANVAALGEMLYHQEYKNACMITLGTGVGGGIVLNGKAIEGVHGAAGEIGHLLIAEEYNFPCSCGLNGCLETVASATGIVRLAHYHRQDYATMLPEHFSAKDIYDFAKKKDPLSMFVVDKVGYYIAKCISILSVTIDVDVYYIGGGVSKAGQILIESIQKHYEKLAHYAVKKVSIELATLSNDAGILGAANLIEACL